MVAAAPERQRSLLRLFQKSSKRNIIEDHNNNNKDTTSSTSHDKHVAWDESPPRISPNATVRTEEERAACFYTVRNKMCRGTELVLATKRELLQPLQSHTYYFFSATRNLHTRSHIDHRLGSLYQRLFLDISHVHETPTMQHSLDRNGRLYHTRSSPVVLPYQYARSEGIARGAYVTTISILAK